MIGTPNWVNQINFIAIVFDHGEGFDVSKAQL